MPAKSASIAQSDDAKKFAPSYEGKFREVSSPSESKDEYLAQLRKSFSRKRKPRRLLSPSYMQETHLGGRLEHVPGFDPFNAMTDGPIVGLNHARQPVRSTPSPMSDAEDSDTADFRSESIFGEGTLWTRIQETSLVPWRSVCHLEIRYESGRTATGTGWVASPDTVITAGHNVLSQEGDGWATGGIRVIPGRNSNIWPFDETSAAAIDALSGWTTDRSERFDLGVIKLADTQLGLRTGWFGYTVMSDQDLQSGVILHNAGYPGETRLPGTQWFDASRASSFSNAFIRYRLDTEPGQSGSPIFYSDFQGQRLVVATHVYGAPNSNLGLRINRGIFDTISAWIAG